MLFPDGKHFQTQRQWAFRSQPTSATDLRPYDGTFARLWIHKYSRAGVPILRPKSMRVIFAIFDRIHKVEWPPPADFTWNMKATLRAR